MSPYIACVARTACRLGEGPCWDHESGSLYWVDIKACTLHRYGVAGGEVQHWFLPEPVGAVVSRIQGGLLLALRRGFATFDPQTGALHRLFDPEPESPQNRLNDGKCDALGRFWVGSMHDPEQQPTGHLYRLDPDLRLRCFPMGFVVTNGPCWSGDGRTFYFNDSVQRRIYAFAFDLAKGQLGPRRLFAQVPPDAGHPDGQCVDAEDCLWTAHWNGGRVTRYRPDGTVDRVVALPTPLVTSCCFGGQDLSTLYVTTARAGLTPAALDAAPLSGGLFAITGLGVKGRASARFAG